MNNPSTSTPPSNIGDYILQNGSVQFDPGKEKHITIMMGQAYVDGFVLDSATNTATCAIMIIPFVAGMLPCMERVEMATLANPKAISELLGARGCIVRDARQVSKYLMDSAAAVPKVLVRELVKSPRWLADYRAFFTGKKLITSTEIDPERFWADLSEILCAGPEFLVR
jgi:hypothetical protein